MERDTYVSRLLPIEDTNGSRHLNCRAIWRVQPSNTDSIRASDLSLRLTLPLKDSHCGSIHWSETLPFRLPRGFSQTGYGRRADCSATQMVSGHDSNCKRVLTRRSPSLVKLMAQLMRCYPSVSNSDELATQSLNYLSNPDDGRKPYSKQHYRANVLLDPQGQHKPSRVFNDLILVRKLWLMQCRNCSQVAFGRFSD